MYDLSGKVAIVTGAGGKRGLGRAISRRLAMEGADVVVSDKVRVPPRSEDLTDDWQGIDSVADEIKAAGRRALALTCDVADSKEVDEMVSATMSEFGRLDILVNNAGVDIYGHALDLRGGEAILLGRAQNNFRRSDCAKNADQFGWPYFPDKEFAR